MVGLSKGGPMSQRILSLIVQDQGVDAALFGDNIRECRYVRSEFFEFPEPIEVDAESEESEQDDFMKMNQR